MKKYAISLKIFKGKGIFKWKFGKSSFLKWLGHLDGGTVEATRSV